LTASNTIFSRNTSGLSHGQHHLTNRPFNYYIKNISTLQQLQLHELFTGLENCLQKLSVIPFNGY